MSQLKPPTFRAAEPSGATSNPFSHGWAGTLLPEFRHRDNGFKCDSPHSVRFVRLRKVAAKLSASKMDETLRHAVNALPGYPVNREAPFLIPCTAFQPE